MRGTESWSWMYWLGLASCTSAQVHRQGAMSFCLPCGHWSRALGDGCWACVALGERPEGVEVLADQLDGVVDGGTSKAAEDDDHGEAEEVPWREDQAQAGVDGL